MEQKQNLSISIPMSKVDVKNLENLFNAKGKLLLKAVGNDMTWRIEPETVTFHWSRIPSAEETEAYTNLISKICERTLTTRISAKRKNVENEKYSFRCFLLGLGMIGEEYKVTRKILLKPLRILMLLSV